MRGVGAGLATLPSDFFCQWSIPFPLINFMKNLFMQCLGFPEACCHSDRRCPSLLEENKQDEHMPCHNLWPIIRKLCNFNYIKSRFLNQPQFAELSLSDNYLYLIFSLSLFTLNSKHYLSLWLWAFQRQSANGCPCLSCTGLTAC